MVMFCCNPVVTQICLPLLLPGLREPKLELSKSCLWARGSSYWLQFCVSFFIVYFGEDVLECVIRTQLTKPGSRYLHVLQLVHHCRLTEQHVPPDEPRMSARDEARITFQNTFIGLRPLKEPSQSSTPLIQSTSNKQVGVMVNRVQC